MNERQKKQNKILRGLKKIFPQHAFKNGYNGFDVYLNNILWDKLIIDLYNYNGSIMLVSTERNLLEYIDTLPSIYSVNYEPAAAVEAIKKVIETL